MVSLGCDYSWARPGGAALKAAGVVAAGRYLASDGRGITAAEYQDLRANGIGVWVCREGAATGMLSGFAQGVADAQEAERQVSIVGLPANIPIYWTADFDIGPGSTYIAPAESYVDGWNTVIPPGRRGGYGGLWFLNYIRSRGKVDALWECGSTSFRHGVDPASVHLHIQQTTNTPPVPGTDHNYIYDTTSFAGGGAVPISNLSTEEDMAHVYVQANDPKGSKFAWIVVVGGGFGVKEFTPANNRADWVQFVNLFNAQATARGEALIDVNAAAPNVTPVNNDQYLWLVAQYAAPSVVPVVNVPAPVVNVDEAAIVKGVLAGLPSTQVDAAQITADIVAAIRSLAFKAS